MLENFRPGTMEKWGLGPEDVHARNPRAIYARVTGYGQTGRYRDRPGFASAGEAICGLRYINGYPGQAPPRAGISLGDTLAAQSAFQGILLALYARDARGAEGQVVDASIIDACFAMTRVVGARVREDRLRPRADRRRGCRASRRPTSTEPRTSSWVVIAANHDTLWRRLAALMGQPELGEDPRFADHHARGENEDLLDEIIGAWAISTRPRSSTSRQRGRRRLRAGLHAAEHLQGSVLHRARPARRVRGRGARQDDAARSIVPKLDRDPGQRRRAARWTLGADNAEVLEGLGVDEAVLQRLRDDG